MLRRITLGALLFAMGAYTSISLFVDDWEGRRCWAALSSSTYDRLPFGVAFRGAWNDSLSNHLLPTAFIFAVLAVLITPWRFITIAAFLVIGLPLALTVYEKIMLGFDPYCDGHGEEALGAVLIQLFFVLPNGFVLLLVALLAARMPVSSR
jgi:hypothetical protein